MILELLVIVGEFFNFDLLKLGQIAKQEILFNY